MPQDLLTYINFVVQHSDYVSINYSALDQFTSNFKYTQNDHWIHACPFQYRALPNIKDEIDRRFLSDALAFCFWGYPRKWTIGYEGKSIDGWWALLAVIQKALETGIEVFDGNILRSLTFNQVSALFDPLPGYPKIPLLQERFQIIHDLGEILVAKYSGRFHHFLETAPKDAVELVLAIAHTFPTFDDVSKYKNHDIPFFKKAQLLVDELSDELILPGLNLKGVDRLIGKADYKIPALMRQYNLLSFDYELAQKVDNRIELIMDSPEEIEIRANMLWVNHLLVNKLRSKYPKLTPMTLDGILWVMSQSKSPDQLPYHLTYTTDY